MELQRLEEKLQRGEEFTTHDASLLGFSETHEVLDFMKEIALSEVKNSLSSAKTSRTASGGQGDTYFFDGLPYVFKQINSHYDDIPNEKTRTGFEIAYRRLGGLVTPFIPLEDNGIITGAFAKKVEALDAKHAHVDKNGKDFIDDWLTLIESIWQRGVFDHDFKCDGLGLDDGRLVVLDFGLSEDAHDASLYVPNPELYWDTFHIGIDKLRRTIHEIRSANPDASAYLQSALQQRFGIEIPDGSLNRGSVRMAPYAQQLRNAVQSKTPQQQKEHAVYPLLGGSITDSVLEGVRKKYYDNR